MFVQERSSNAMFELCICASRIFAIYIIALTNIIMLYEKYNQNVYTLISY